MFQHVSHGKGRPSHRGYGNEALVSLRRGGRKTCMQRGSISYNICKYDRIRLTMSVSIYWSCLEARNRRWRAKKGSKNLEEAARKKKWDANYEHRRMSLKYIQAYEVASNASNTRHAKKKVRRIPKDGRKRNEKSQPRSAGLCHPQTTFRQKNGASSSDREFILGYNYFNLHWGQQIC